MGTVQSSYRFEGLCDYQYVTTPEVVAALDPSPRPQGVPFDVRQSLKPLAEQAMRIPRAFSMHDTPLDYLPKKGAAGAIGDFAADLVAGERGVGAAAKPSARTRWGEAPPDWLAVGVVRVRKAARRAAGHWCARRGGAPRMGRGCRCILAFGWSTTLPRCRPLRRPKSRRPSTLKTICTRR